MSISKAAAEGPRPRDGVRGGGRGRPHRAAARQSHLVVPLAQCVAASAVAGPLHRPDLLGMGNSDKLPDSGPGAYRFVEHRRYLDALLEALDVRERVTLVVHDWGSALGFDWANRHREAVKGIAYMEAIVRPQDWTHWDLMNMRPVLQQLRSEAGEEMVLQDNFFVEEILPKAVLRTLSEEEMAEYRRPFAEPGEGRRPTLTWVRQIPIDGEPADVAEIATSYADWLATSSVPKLFVKAEPGALLAGGANLEFARGLPAQTEVTVPGCITSRKTRRTRSGEPSPTGWERWADRGPCRATICGWSNWHGSPAAAK
ncbi:haloalkane dehalogenase [Streptomyces chiangmaiensis]